MPFNYHDFIAGLIGGIAGFLVGHPGDTIKVRQQTYNSTLWLAIKKTFKHEGIRGFFKGMLFPLLTMGPSKSVFFGVYGNSLYYLQGTLNRPTQFSDPSWQQKVFYAGCIAGFATVLATCPVELIKTVQQANTEGKGNWDKTVVARETKMLACIKNIYKNHGVSGLYRGLVPMLYRDVPTYGVYTWIYEFMMRRCFQSSVKNEVGRQILAGGSAGVISWMLVIPLDVVKSKIQADNPKNPKYNGMVDCFYKSYKTEGLAVFGKGFVVVCLRAFPVSAATFVGYEATLKLLSKYL